MSDVLALIPARSGSKGIPSKNWRDLAGRTPVRRALDVAMAIDGVHIVLTSDRVVEWVENTTLLDTNPPARVTSLYAPAPLHADTCAMIDVVQDALARVPGPPEQIVVLLQPTQPLRQPKHVTAAIELLEASGADSVVSVTPTESPDKLMRITEAGQLKPWNPEWFVERRQHARPAYRRDGTCYCFKRHTVERHGTLYGLDVRPLIIPAEETCALDTPADWLEAERRLRDLPPVQG